MATWTKQEIEQKIRQVTGRFSSNELSEVQLQNRLNQFYQFTFPAELKLDRNLGYYEFLTTPNQPTYDLPTNYVNFKTPATIDNFELLWYQSPTTFANENSEQITRLTEWTGDGATVAFSTTVTGFPIYPGTVVITDNVESFEDTNETYTISNVGVAGSLGGSATLNYSTGTISVTFATAPTNGQNIYLSYVVFQPGRPQSVLKYNNQFKFYPVPDTAYRFKVPAWKVFDALTNGTDIPELEEWGPCLAYGTSKQIFADAGEMDRYAEVHVLYKEQLNYVLKRTLNDLLNVRAMPNF